MIQLLISGRTLRLEYGSDPVRVFDSLTNEDVTDQYDLCAVVADAAYVDNAGEIQTLLDCMTRRKEPASE